MAVKKMPYQNLNHALRLFRGQVMEGIPYAQENIPPLNSPEKIFNWLKLRTKYKNDPKGTELFQTLPTLLDNNYHGLTGHGDCDCFTIAALSILLANGFTDCGIVLVGRSPLTAVHIYAWVNDKGEKKILDLTNRVFNYERSYPYKQFINFKLTPKEKQAMTLQLASNGNELLPGYIWMPSQGVHLREDIFDDTMSGSEFQDMLLSEGYLPQEAGELLAGRAKRQARRAQRQEKKATKQQQKKEKRAAKIDIKKARAEKKRTGGGWKDVLNTVTDSAGKIIGRVRGEAPEQQTDFPVPYAQQPAYYPPQYEDVSYVEDVKRKVNGTTPTPKEEDETVTIFGKEIKKSTAIWGGVGLTLGVAGIAYAATRK